MTEHLLGNRLFLSTYTFFDKLYILTILTKILFKKIRFLDIVLCVSVSGKKSAGVSSPYH